VTIHDEDMTFPVEDGVVVRDGQCRECGAVGELVEDCTHEWLVCACCGNEVLKHEVADD